MKHHLPHYLSNTELPWHCSWLQTLHRKYMNWSNPLRMGSTIAASWCPAGGSTEWKVQLCCSKALQDLIVAPFVWHTSTKLAVAVEGPALVWAVPLNWITFTMYSHLPVYARTQVGHYAPTFVGGDTLHLFSVEAWIAKAACFSTHQTGFLNSYFPVKVCTIVRE